MKKLLIIGLLLCLMSGCQKNTGTFAQGDKNLSIVFADINEQIADGAFSIPLLKDTALSEREVEALYQLDGENRWCAGTAWGNCIVSGEEGT